MSLILTIIAFVLIFSLLIVVHEWGHFWAAKRAGVKVEEFGFGLPPRIWGFKKGETLYSINWIPFGGFVRMLGEDSAEGKKSKRSINNQPLRVQAFVIMAGVIMNLLLAFFLLTVGLWIGIEPLIASSEDFEKAAREGLVNLEPGIVITASTLDGLDLGDRVLAWDGVGNPSLELWDQSLEKVRDGEDLTLTVRPVEAVNGEVFSWTLDKAALEEVDFATLYFPRLVYTDLPNSSWSDLLETGDVLLSINGVQVFSAGDLSAAIQGKGQETFQVYRPSLGQILDFSFAFEAKHPILADLKPGSPAEMAGLRPGDQILSINGKGISLAETLQEMTQELRESGATFITYEVRRAEATMFLDIPLGEDGLVGIYVADAIPYYGNLSLYESYVPHSLMSIETVRYGLFKAPIVALEELWRLGKLTAVLFVDVLTDFLSGGKVPEGVAGPVGIAQMTSVTIQNGWAATIRFVAMLSLSLGVINILPIPALDGGRLFFIVIQALTGKRPKPHIEGWIHNFGFIFLLLFLAYVTFNDVLNLF